MRGKSNSGFTILELMIVIAIVALLGTVMVPNLRGGNPSKERQQWISELNDLMSFAWFNGITSGKIQRIVFDFENSTIKLEQQKTKEEKPGQESTYEQITRAYTKTTLSWPSHFHIKNFFIEGFDEVARYGKLNTTWFFLVPDGLTQDVILNIIDMNDKSSARKGTSFSLVLNPFSAQFKEHNNFQNIK